jgi:hypothetical protein
MASACPQLPIKQKSFGRRAWILEAMGDVVRDTILLTILTVFAGQSMPYLYT